MSAKPVLHYLDIKNLGRGEVVRLFLHDAGIDFEDKRYPLDDSWAKNKADLKEKGLTVTGLVPSLEYKGVVLTQHIPILRYLSRELGQYDGETNYDKWLVDAVSDIYIDWRDNWVRNFFNPFPEYKTETAPAFYKNIDHYYSKDKSGPYLLGNTVSYADFAVFQAIDNDITTGGIAQDALPESLVVLKKAIEGRPNVVEYLKTR
ncbi:hypothetical protein ASPWEDRAFT_117442 [Aspergillus wentii DTO 134E9]|uniref:GST N-terminal domain-containing protein n=1 Tax=Aspergillus wentii DTO 134E9 TaxID=1073089 RepID=A0A1L9RAJ2_ASPWE|nr:uncharacterized protein ASPWEDRAFT_117442 [Aspergillus wentii DTO 134E9]KAI9934526.1 hypothetical protein MW887_000140 [Aspergillus wentii]OJJ31942.1 hypothetical protein ASPWEDRAFT_117442 [Aspergillus wentii DTO 134E9]